MSHCHPQCIGHKVSPLVLCTVTAVNKGFLNTTPNSAAFNGVLFTTPVGAAQWNKSFSSGANVTRLLASALEFMRSLVYSPNWKGLVPMQRQASTYASTTSPSLSRGTDAPGALALLLALLAIVIWATCDHTTKLQSLQCHTAMANVHKPLWQDHVLCHWPRAQISHEFVCSVLMLLPFGNSVFFHKKFWLPKNFALLKISESKN